MSRLIMTREEIIKNAAQEYCQKNIPNLPQMHLAIETAFEAGAKWADEHPINPWHSVKDRELPQEAKDCIFSYQGELYKGFMFEDGELHFDDEFSPMLGINEVDYWMEIPKLPTE